MAVLALLCSAVAVWARTRRASVANALTRWRARAALSGLRRDVLPSMALSRSPAGGTRSRTKATNTSRKTPGATARNNRRSVSSLGAPGAQGRISRQRANLDAPYASMSSQPAAPAITPQSVTNKISGTGCKTFPASRRSSHVPKWSQNGSIGRLMMASPDGRGLSSCHTNR